MKKTSEKTLPQPVSGPIRDAVRRARTLKDVSQATGLAYSVVHGFAGGGDVSSRTLDVLAAHFGLVATPEK